METEEKLMLYNLIPEKEYSYYEQKHREELYRYKLKNNVNYFGYTVFDATKQTFVHFIKDYAAYEAHRDKWKDKGNKLDTIHLALKVIQNFVSIWDYMGYGLNIIFELGIKEKESNFSSVACLICCRCKGNLKKMTKKLIELYEKEADLRKWRNEFTHRFHTIYFRKTSYDTPDNKLKNLDKLITASYERIMKAFEIYFKIILEETPRKDYGSLPLNDEK